LIFLRHHALQSSLYALKRDPGSLGSFFLHRGKLFLPVSRSVPQKLK